MKVTLESKHEVGDRATWSAPYGFETVEITGVEYNKYMGQFEYYVKEYKFKIAEREL